MLAPITEYDFNQNWPTGNNPQTQNTGINHQQMKNWWQIVWILVPMILLGAKVING